jgi:hypothetical protein
VQQDIALCGAMALCWALQRAIQTNVGGIKALGNEFILQQHNNHIHLAADKTTNVHY